MINKKKLIFVKIYLFMFLFAIGFSCTREGKKEKSYPKKEESIYLLEGVKEEGQDTLSGILEKPKLSISFSYRNPKDKATLKEWQQLVVEKGSEYFYDHLSNYYSENPHLQDEMIKYSEIMITKYKKSDGYITDFYDYVKDSKSAQKGKLMIRAIKYLKESLKNGEDPLGNVGDRLSELYREGIYVKKDTVIADYLYSGGRNLDSIIQVRKIIK